MVSNTDINQIDKSLLKVRACHIDYLISIKRKDPNTVISTRKSTSCSKVLLKKVPSPVLNLFFFMSISPFIVFCLCLYSRFAWFQGYIIF